MNPVIGVLLLLIVLSAIMYSRIIGRRRGQEEALITEDPTKPYLWLFYDTTQVNSRLWADFGARSSRALNTPYLNLCYESILKNADDYNVKVIKGIESVAEILGGWDKLPEDMQSSVVVLNARQRRWIRDTILEQRGGLWLNPSVIVMRPIPVLSANTLFGGDLDDCIAIYAVKGGTERPYVSDVRSLRVDTVEDLMASTLPDESATALGGLPPVVVPEDIVFVPIPSDELHRFRKSGWFLKSSEEQILQSPIMVSYIFHKALGY